MEPDDEPKGAGGCGSKSNKVCQAAVDKGVKECLELIEACQKPEDDTSGDTVVLDLCNKKLTSSGFERVAPALLEHGNLPVLDLNINNNRLGNTGASLAAELVMSPSPIIRCLDLRLNRISEFGAEHLSLALRKNTTVLSLKLSSNDFGTNGAVWMAAALKENTTLTRFELEYNRILDEGVTKIAESMKSNSSLTALHLRANEFTEEGARALAAALEVNQALKTLDISTNCIGDDGAAALTAALQANKTLEELPVFGCEIESETKAELKAALERNRVLRVSVPAVQQCSGKAAGNGGYAGNGKLVSLPE